MPIGSPTLVEPFYWRNTGVPFFLLQHIRRATDPNQASDRIVSRGFVRLRFGAWREEHAKSRAALQGEILSLVWAEPDFEKTLLLLQVEIVNTGQPTIARGWELKALLADGTELIAIPSHLRVGLKLRSGTETTTLDKLVYEEATTPIASGGQVGGWIGFELPLRRDRLRKSDTTIKLSFRDVRGNSYFVTCAATGTGIGLKYHPGAGAVLQAKR